MSIASLRADLQRRGLIDEQYRLTDAGQAYCDDLLRRLPDARAFNDPNRKGRKWDMRWRHERPS